MNSEDQNAAKSVQCPVAVRSLLTEVESLILEAQAATRPLELQPFRGRLFEQFVAADRSGLIPDEAAAAPFDDADEDDPDLQLTADTLCRLLARRWGLDMAAREAQAMQTRLPAEQLERMRLLWSVMRMWMEWSYAWQRWAEFHAGPPAADGEISN
ncbi:MAG: hypothetical protein RIT02_4091 [Planctomycetota bacterium]|jgi:hypothetical protein